MKSFCSIVEVCSAHIQSIFCCKLYLTLQYFYSKTIDKIIVKIIFIYVNSYEVLKVYKIHEFFKKYEIYSNVSTFSKFID